MMTMSRIFRFAAIMGVLGTIFSAGCAEKLALKPVPGQKDSFKITHHSRRSINWQGPVPEKAAFEESYNDDKVEMVLTRQIKGVDNNGVAIAQVTFDSLKYVSVVKNVTKVDFDSSRPSDADNSMAKLTGKSYTIEFGPDNSVISVPDVNNLRSMFTSRTDNDRAANNLLLNDSIIDRHSALLLPKDRTSLKPGETWNRIKTFSFGLMGIKSYEKIYTLREIRKDAKHQIAVIDMNAIPSSEVESKFRSQQAGANFPKMFDTNETYTGTGEVDLTSGEINSYSENLQASWIAAMPPNPGEAADANEPVVLRMTATRDYTFERIK
jgi:hypothetical protein